MQRYVMRRIFMAIPVLLLVSFMTFSLIRIVPGDVVLQMIGESGLARDRDIALIKQQLGLDRPFHEQYVTWMSGMLRGDMGLSLWTGKPARDELFRRIPVSAELGALALLIALVIAIPIGIVSATRQDTASDYVGRLIAISGLSMPDFWIATLAITFLAIWFQWMPRIGFVGLFDDPLLNLQQLIIPASIMGFRLSAVTMRMVRSTMLEVLRQDYIRTAWSKGLKERAVIYRHALKNALIPVITIVGTQVERLLAGAIIIETIFVLPGVGRLTLESIQQRDYTQLQGNVMFIAVVMVSVNLIVDISYAWFDPRIRYR